MDINFSDADNQFRQEVKDYLENKYPKHVKEKQNNGEQLTKQDMIDYHKSLYEQGWAGYNWPVEYGGTGWSPTQIYIFQEELGYANTPTILPFGLNMVGPVIYTFGNEEQKKKFLPDILEFNTWWCQGYSEPGSGSDLASLKTKAVRDGDHYIVNGSKTWTTLAQNADWIFCLVRTETTQKKQEGISFLLIDMKTEGIEVKPIITIDGDHEVNSVFFTDVKVPAENLIGEEGKGFTYAMAGLDGGRLNIAASALGGAQFAVNSSLTYMEERKAFGKALNQFQALQFKLADMEVKLQTARTFLRQAAWKLDTQAKDASKFCAMAKLYVTDTSFEVANEALQLHGGYGYLTDYGIEKIVRDLRVHQILEGTNEIMRLIISRQMLTA